MDYAPIEAVVDDSAQEIGFEYVRNSSTGEPFADECTGLRRRGSRMTMS